MISEAIIDSSLDLRSIFSGKIFSPTGLEKMFLDENPSELAECISQFRWRDWIASPEASAENWKDLLELNLLNRFFKGSNEQILSKIAQLEKQTWNRQAQQCRLLIALNHAVAHLSVPDPSPLLLAGGAAPIDLDEYAPWLSLPYTPEHLEYGIFLACLALLSGRTEFKEATLRLARWQLNTLDASFYPFPSLFIQEYRYDPLRHLVVLYLLFRAAASLSKDPLFISATGALMDHLIESPFLSDGKLPLLWVLIEQLFPALKSPEIKIGLPSQFSDSSTGLVGYRKQDCYAVSALHGGHTGLGCLSLRGIDIVNFGPQYLPLDDCRGFGIEGNYLIDHGVRKTHIETDQEGFCIKGCTRMVDQPQNHFRGIWLEMVQRYRAKTLSIQTNLLGIDGWEGVAFCFYVKAKQCRLANGKIALRGALGNIQADAQPLWLEQGEERVQLKAEGAFSSMQIIPLEGRKSFWGAHFLVAYHLDSKNSHFNYLIA